MTHPTIELSFPGGKRVDAHFGPFHLRTDQPVELGGQAAEPAPFDLFLASMATCAGIYALGFCQARGIPTEGLRVRQEVVDDPATGLPSAFHLFVDLPPGFPERYRASIQRSVEACKVKKTIALQPSFQVHLSPPAPSTNPGETPCATA